MHTARELFTKKPPVYEKSSFYSLKREKKTKKSKFKNIQVWMNKKNETSFVFNFIRRSARCNMCLKWIEIVNLIDSKQVCYVICTYVFTASTYLHIALHKKKYRKKKKRYLSRLVIRLHLHIAFYLMLKCVTVHDEWQSIFGLLFRRTIYYLFCVLSLFFFYLPLRKYSKSKRCIIIQLINSHRTANRRWNCGRDWPIANWLVSNKD